MPNPIGTYINLNYDELANVFHPWDTRAPEVASQVAELITSRMPDARVEHVGSTAIPGCDGKGIVDLLLMYTPGRLEVARDTLDDLGFQRQTGLDPFPEERPLRLGAFEYDGETFRLHVHVIAANDPEAAEQLAFRDRLRADPALVEEYVASKRSAFDGGGINNVEYNRAKAPFIKRVNSL